jgi:3-hydroxybutyryl-CoA dehydrogenase
VKGQEGFEADQAANASTDLAGQTLEIAANAPRWRALTHASSVPVHENAGLPPETAKLGHVDISLSAGASARALASERGRAHCVLDWWDANRDVSVLGFSASHPEAATMASQLITALGRAPLQVADRPGAVVHRTLLQLANAAADAVRDHVADADGVDKAMIHGVNYPFGPLAWAKAEGYAQVVSALRTIADETGDPLYQPSEWLSRQAMEIST